MAEAVVSSGVGALLAPAQSAASGAVNVQNSSAKDAVSDENSSSFSTVLAGQGESTTDLNSTQTVAETTELVVVDNNLIASEIIDVEVVVGGQDLPQVGNALPVEGDVTTEMVLAAVGAEEAAETLDALAFDSAIAQNQPLDPSANQAFVIDPALLEKIAQSLQVVGADVAASTEQSVDPLTAPLDGSGQVVTVAPAVIAPLVAQSPVTEAAIEQQSTAASLDLISLLDRKAKVNDGQSLADTVSQVFDTEVDSDNALPADSLLMKNAKSSFTVNLQANLDGALLKTADLALAMSPKSSQSLEINALPLWRQQGVQSYASAQPAATTLSIDVPVGKPSWGEAVLDKVMWMSSQKLDSADIALDPVDLGPMHVKISTHNDQTTVVFTSLHSQVRDALDQASGQLRQSLENQGFNQVNVDVSGQSAGQQLASQAQADSSGNRSANGEPLNDEQAVSVERLAMGSTDINKLGLIDTFV